MKAFQLSKKIWKHSYVENVQITRQPVGMKIKHSEQQKLIGEHKQQVFKTPFFVTGKKLILCID